jgi:hypothetical protein
MTTEEERTQDHLEAVLEAILRGYLVPFLGAGVNLCGRPPHTEWKQGAFLPSGGELSERLADEFSYKKEWGNRQDLLRVSQYVATTRGTGPLFLDLHRCFNADYPLTVVHRFLAGLPKLLRARGHKYCPMLIATTNYDDVMERAFHEAGEPVQVVTYICEGELRGKFMHHRADGQRVVIDIPNEFRAELLEQTPVIFKLHGTIEREQMTPASPEGAPGDESFVITEDHYIEYLAQAGDAGPVPLEILKKLARSSILFLGYSLGDWNLRVLLKRIWLKRDLTWKWWAVNPFANDVERAIWKERGVDIQVVKLENYFAQLKRMLVSHLRRTGHPGQLRSPRR